MSRLTKTPSEIALEIVSHALDAAGNINIVFTAANPYSHPGSIADFQYSTDAGTTWNAADISNDISFDPDTFAIPGKVTRFTLIWSAIDDLWYGDFAEVRVRLSLYDRANQSGRETATETYVIGAVDFTPDNITVVKRPNNRDPYLDFQFLNTALPRPVGTHFIIELDDVSDFSGINASVNSSADQSNWSADSVAFPAAGIDGSQGILIDNNDPVFDALANQDWYWRIRRITADSHYTAAITSLADDGVIPENQTVTVNGALALE